MPEFEFQNGASFDENMEAFIDHLDEIDEEMSAVLRANLSLLVSIVKNGEKNSSARIKFNASVLAALDEILVAQTESAN